MAGVSAEWTYSVGAVLVVGMGLYSVYRLNRLVNLGDWLRRKLGHAT